MSKQANKIYLVIVAALTVVSLLLVFPQLVNKLLGYLNWKFIPNLSEAPFKLGLDLKGGCHLVYEADVSQVAAKDQKEAMQGLRDVIERRVNLFGVTEAVVSYQSAGASQRLVVEMPGVKDVNQAIEMIGKTPYLEFKQERPEAERDALLVKQQAFQDEMKAGQGQPEAVVNAILQKYSQELDLNDPYYPYFVASNLTGRYVKKATLGFDQTAMTPEVLIDFNDEGATLFKDLTEKNVGKKIAIYIDNSLISSPVVREVIGGGSAQITGTFTNAEAKDLVRNLNAGALPMPIKLISQTTVGPTLGADSLRQSLMAAWFGLLGICLFMLVFYRFSGLIACVSLIIYGGVLLCLFKFVPVTLTLAGIGGAVLSVGMAVDANVLIFERIKEERKKNESFQKALELGFSRAWPSIRDSNLTTLLIAVIMFGFGSSFVKGFALTLSLGILISMFSAMFITKVLMNAFADTRWEKFKRFWL